MYTDICIKMYFGLWMKAAKKVKAQGKHPYGLWLFVLIWFDNKHGIKGREYKHLIPK